MHDCSNQSKRTSVTNICMTTVIERSRCEQSRQKEQADDKFVSCRQIQKLKVFTAELILKIEKPQNDFNFRSHTVCIFSKRYRTFVDHVFNRTWNMYIKGLFNDFCTVVLKTSVIWHQRISCTKKTPYSGNMKEIIHTPPHLPLCVLLMDLPTQPWILYLQLPHCQLEPRLYPSFSSISQPTKQEFLITHSTVVQQ